MADTKKPYVVTDRRRVGARGQRRDPPNMRGRRQVEFIEIRDPLDTAFKYFRAQIEHALPHSTWPRSGELPAILRAFIISTQQLYASTIILMADNRPKQLVMPAGVLARALVEGLGNLFALLEDPGATASFLRDDYLNTSRKVAYYEKRFAGQAAIASAIAKEKVNLTQYARGMGLSQSEIDHPENLEEWPTPGRLLRSKKPPRLAGERRKVFEECHNFWYRSLSAFAHHRLTALQIALHTEEQVDEESLILARSATANLAVVVSLCVLSEVEHHCDFAPCSPLRVTWERIRDLDDLTKMIYGLRYARLLGMSPIVPTP